MPRFAANLSMLWPELDVYDRFRAARDAGFRRVEILFLHPLDLGRVEQLLWETRLELVLFDPAAGNWDASERGIACLPGRQDEFQRALRGALQTAQRLGVKRLNVLTGIPGPGISEVQARQTIVDNFKAAVPLAEQASVTLLVENINNTDFPGYYVTTVKRAADIVNTIQSPNVRLQLDQYHVGMMGGDARNELRKHISMVEHVQIADVPGRHEPGTGRQPIPEFLADLDQLGYSGAVGLEYRPSATTDASLNWLPRDGRA